VLILRAFAVTGCSRDVLKMRKKTRAEQQFVLQLGEKCQKHHLPHISCFMWFTSSNPDIQRHVVHKSEHTSCNSKHDTNDNSGECIELQTPWFLLLFLFGPNSSPWALAIFIAARGRPKTAVHRFQSWIFYGRILRRGGQRQHLKHTASRIERRTRPQHR